MIDGSADRTIDVVVEGVAAGVRWMGGERWAR